MCRAEYWKESYTVSSTERRSWKFAKGPPGGFSWVKIRACIRGNYHKAWKITTERAKGNSPWSSPRTRNSAYSHQPEWTSHRILRRISLCSGTKITRHAKKQIHTIKSLKLTQKWYIIELYILLYIYMFKYEDI